MFASLIRTPENLLDWRAGDWDTLIYEPCTVPEPVSMALLAYLEVFGLAFGCFDFMIGPGDTWWYGECNPNGQWGFLPDAETIATAFARLLGGG